MYTIIDNNLFLSRNKMRIIFFKKTINYLRAVRARSNHIWLEQGPLKKNMVVIEGLVDGGEDGLRDRGTLLDVVASVGEHLRLHDGHQPILLTYNGVAG